MTTKVRALKLMTGEEVIGRIPSSGEQYDINEWSGDGIIVLEKVLSLALHPGPAGAVQVGLVPFSICGGDNQIIFHRHAVVGEPKKVDARIEKEYLQQTSGIALATK